MADAGDRRTYDSRVAGFVSHYAEMLRTTLHSEFMKELEAFKDQVARDQQLDENQRQQALLAAINAQHGFEKKLFQIQGAVERFELKAKATAPAFLDKQLTSSIQAIMDGSETLEEAHKIINIALGKNKSFNTVELIELALFGQKQSVKDAALAIHSLSCKEFAKTAVASSVPRLMTKLTQSASVEKMIADAGAGIKRKVPKDTLFSQDSLQGSEALAGRSPAKFGKE